jgi:hypothetical protein
LATAAVTVNNVIPMTEATTSVVGVLMKPPVSVRSEWFVLIAGRGPRAFRVGTIRTGPVCGGDVDAVRRSGRCVRAHPLLVGGFRT